MQYDAVKDNYATVTSGSAPASAGINAAAYQAQVSAVRNALEAAVQRQLMSDVPYGVLLSGGLDSSVISAIAKKYAGKRIETDNKSDAWWPRLHSFAVGLKGAPDLLKAREVAQHIGTVHHEINYTVQEGLDALRDVIYFIETYDVTTVRASTPMYLLARVIKSMGIKMVLSGEGADEVFGGYLYFHKAPTPQAFHEETVRKLSKLYLYDCLRANKSLSAWGVEGRVPFLDKEFLDVAMRLNPAIKMCPGREIEKKVVRDAFADMLPESVAWRQKEQFSDGVGYNWIDTLKAVTTAAVSDEQMRKAAERFPVNTPMNKEEYYYRTIFEEHFPGTSAAKSVPSAPIIRNGALPVRRQSAVLPAVSASAAASPTAAQSRSAWNGPCRHAAASHKSRPPSSGRTGRRLKHPSTSCAPAKSQNTSASLPSHASPGASRRFTSGPAAVTSISPP